jgi:hypothetical protein
MRRMRAWFQAKKSARLTRPTRKRTRCGGVGTSEPDGRVSLNRCRSGSAKTAGGVRSRTAIQ